MDAILVLYVLTFVCTTYAYNILILYPAPSFSHQQPIMILTEALVNKGHQVFVVSPNAVSGLEGNINYTHVDMSFSYKLYSGGVDKNDDPDAANLQKQMSLWQLLEPTQKISKIPSHQFKSEAFQKFQQKVREEKILFDVIVGQFMFMPHVCGIARHLTGGSIPIISFCTFPVDFMTGDPLSSPHPSFLPYLTPYSDRMSMWQKIQNWIIALVWVPKLTSSYEDSARAFFEENFGPEYGRLVDDCWTNASLSLNTGSFLHYYPRLTPPNVVELGAMHIRPPTKLPQDVQEWLDAAEKGVIYFSLGSNMRSKSLPMDVRSNFLRVFSELPDGYRVLWKWEVDGRIPGQSDNILAQKWLPQQSVLAHPKVKLFITQGGFQSFQEAVHYGVPTVGIPWFADQESNVAKMEASGIGFGLWPQELHSYDKIKSAIDRALHDKSYALNMRRLSAISRDFTPHAVDKAVFWVEHVARHRGASHLRPSTADSTYFQYFCLDIISVILMISVVTSYIAVLLVKYLVFMFSKSNSKPKVS